jgi:hypothetical protein
VISRVLGSAGLCAVVVLAGCDADAGEPTTLPDVSPAPAVSSSPDPTPTPTPTVEPPVEPANAHEYSEEGVEAFTLYAIDVINYAYQTNDVTYLEQIMTPDCEACANTVDRLTTIGEAGGRVEGGQMMPDEDGIGVDLAEGVQTSARVDLVVTASTTINGEERVTGTQPEVDVHFIFNLAREGEQWKLDELLRSEPPPS